MNEHPLPLAAPAREAWAKEIFAEYATMSVDEWAARYAHTIGLSSADTYAYHDPVFHTWIHALHHLLREPARVAQARLRYLTEAERAAITRAIAEDF